MRTPRVTRTLPFRWGALLAATVVALGAAAWFTWLFRYDYRVDGERVTRYDRLTRRACAYSTEAQRWACWPATVRVHAVRNPFR